MVFILLARFLSRLLSRLIMMTIIDETATFAPLLQKWHLEREGRNICQFRRGCSKCILRENNHAGEELLSWGLSGQSSLLKLPMGTATLTSLTCVEAFCLKAEDLLYIMSHFEVPFSLRLLCPPIHNQTKHTGRVVFDFSTFRLFHFFIFLCRYFFVSTPTRQNRKTRPLRLNTAYHFPPYLFACLTCACVFCG